MSVTVYNPPPRHVDDRALPALAAMEMLWTYGEAFGHGPLAPATVGLGSMSVQVAGVSADQAVFATACARTTALGTEDLAALASEILGLTVAKTVNPGADAVVLVANDEARAVVTDWLARQSTGQDIHVQVVELGQAWQERLAVSSDGLN